MNTSLKKFLCATLFVGSSFVAIKPLSENGAKIGAGVGGALIGAGAGVGTYCLAFDHHSNQTLRAAVSTLAGVGAGGLSGYLLYQWLYTMTPPGRVAAASLLINNAACDSLICNDFDTSEALYAHVIARFGTSWPLIMGCHRYEAIRQNLEVARNLVNLAYHEAQGNPQYTSLCKECNELNQKITDIIKIAEPRLIALTKHEKHDLQIQLFEKHMEAERQRSHEQKLQAGKLTHNSLEKAKDRWHDDHRDQQKYQHQQNVLNQNQNRPVMLNIG